MSRERVDLARTAEEDWACDNGSKSAIQSS